MGIKINKYIYIYIYSQGPPRVYHHVLDLSHDHHDDKMGSSISHPICLIRPVNSFVGSHTPSVPSQKYFSVFSA